MSYPQGLILLVLSLTLVLFIWGKWRYDIVALLALIACVLVGLIPYSKAFSGFSNPAVITVAEIMVLSYAITNSKAIDYLVAHIARYTKRLFFHISILCLIAMILSAFMNNVGALALLMPIAMQTAAIHKRSPALLLMPLAFASILGGLSTMIGTPPNILIANYRAEILHQPFTMFDFTPVGLSTAGIGVLFIISLGWRLLPKARITNRSAFDVFELQDYVTELRVPDTSKYIGTTYGKLEQVTKGDIAILGLIRKQKKLLRPSAHEALQANDIIIIKAPSKDLEIYQQTTNFELVGGITISRDTLRSDQIAVIEALVMPGSRLEGRTVAYLGLKRKYRINLLALSREGRARHHQRLRQVTLHGGDVLLLQGDVDTLHDNIVETGLIPLAERGVTMGVPRPSFLPLLLFLSAIVVTVAGLLPIQLALAVAIVCLVFSNTMPLRHLYDSLDGPVILLLACMIPVGQALQTSGTSQLLANTILSLGQHMPGFVLLTIVFLITMSLSDIMNNAATTVVMAPIALKVATMAHYHPDPFLMAVAIAASCAFLTPIGHQNNTLVMGPGGYHFGDYWRMGLPLELLITLVSIPLIVWVWPL